MKKVEVYITATVSKYIGTVECDSLDDFEDRANELWESQGFDSPTFCHQCSQDISDWQVDIESAKLSLTGA